MSFEVRKVQPGFELFGHKGARSVCLAVALACVAVPGWALGVSVGGVSASVDISKGGGGVGVGVSVGVGGTVGVDAGVSVGGGGVDADVDVAVGGGGGGGTGGGGTGGGGTGGGGTGGGVLPGDDAVADDDVGATPGQRARAAPRIAMACAGDGNATAFNGFVVRDRQGDVLGWVHDATLSPDDKLLTVRLQSTGKACYKLTGAGFRLRGQEVWTNLDGASFR